VHFNKNKFLESFLLTSLGTDKIIF